MHRLIRIALILVAAFAGITHQPITRAAESAPPAARTPLAQGHPTCAGVSAEQPSTPECDALILSRPYPNVAPLPVDFGVIAGTPFIRFNTTQVPLYDKPDGAQVDTLSAGYTYVAVRQVSGSWAEVRPGRWVDLSIARFAAPSTFTGVTINGLDMPFAWVLWRHCATNVPAGARNCDGSGQLNRYQLVNILRDRQCQRLELAL